MVDLVWHNKAAWWHNLAVAQYVEVIWIQTLKQRTSYQSTVISNHHLETEKFQIKSNTCRIHIYCKIRFEHRKELKLHYIVLTRERYTQFSHSLNMFTDICRYTEGFCSRTHRHHGWMCVTRGTSGSGLISTIIINYMYF